MKVTQAELAARLRIAPNSVARMEQGVMIITPPMELLNHVCRDGRLALRLLTDKQVAEQLQIRRARWRRSASRSYESARTRALSAIGKRTLTHT